MAGHHDVMLYLPFNAITIINYSQKIECWPSLSIVSPLPRLHHHLWRRLILKMGRVRNNRRKNSKKKEYKKAFKTDNRARDVDQIQEDLIKEKERGEKMAFSADDDLPGLGQFYCTPCGRHFFDEASLTSHANSRGHVRRYQALSHCHSYSCCTVFSSLRIHHFLSKLPCTCTHQLDRPHLMSFFFLNWAEIT